MGAKRKGSAMMRSRMTRCMGLALALCLLSLTAAAQRVAPTWCGPAYIGDGDGLVIGTTSLRLFGVDAPETYQICLNSQCARTTCGIEARDRLSAHIAGREVCCVDKGPGGYDRRAAVCLVDGEDLNAWLVQEGMALAYRKYSDAYVKQEKVAREAKRGMWSGAFHAPWDRRRGVKNVLGLLLCSNLAVLEDEGAPTPDCIIKGTVNKGERIYHMVGQRQYGRVKIDGLPKRWFCSEEEAQAAGWRRARN